VQAEHSSGWANSGRVITMTLCLQNKFSNAYLSFGLAWNPLEAKKGHILSASNDMTVAHWDINAYTKAKSQVEPLNIYRGHTSVVGVCICYWHNLLHLNVCLYRT
jgi:WD40 repeat protein